MSQVGRWFRLMDNRYSFGVMVADFKLLKVFGHPWGREVIFTWRLRGQGYARTRAVGLEAPDRYLEAWGRYYENNRDLIAGFVECVGGW